MTSFVIIGIILGIFVFLGIYFLGKKSFSKKESTGDPFLLIQNEIQEIKRTLDLRLSESNKIIQETLEDQLKESARLKVEIASALARFEGTSKQVVDYAQQLKQLQNILINPKQRGVLGEYYLETVLKNVLPPNVYQMQYEFKDGTKVDAVIFVRDKIIPVDSKFSLENYNRLVEEENPQAKKKWEELFKNDLKNRIEETAKYIKPEEKTTEFAFMFIPSEAVYYDLLINKIGAIKSNTKDLVQYAAGEKKVIIVSPTTFLAYLQTVLQGLKALEIEESARIIQKRVEELLRHLSNYETYMKKLGNHLSTTVSMYNQASKEFLKIDKDIYRITGKRLEAEVLSLNPPEEDNFNKDYAE
ncbi:MAG: DNA recombination protein RmuC [Candidatus Paceibacterota bacterium]